MKTIKLPEKPSELIRLALHDLKLTEKDPRYQVDMGSWHQRNSMSGKCEVCFAGAVLAKSIKLKPYVDYRVIDFDEVNGSKLAALDAFRKGLIEYALHELGIYNHKFKDVEVPEYDENPSMFKKSIRKIATKLHKAAL